jgi:hypothetical protein
MFEEPRRTGHFLTLKEASPVNNENTSSKYFNNASDSNSIFKKRMNFGSNKDNEEGKRLLEVYQSRDKIKGDSKN